VRRLTLLILLALAACASNSGPGSRVSRAPDQPAVLTSRDFPEEITGLLTAAEADSCGVCIREKRADAFELAEEWFAPETTVQVGTGDGWRVLPGGEMELHFGPASDTSPTLSFRFHTDDIHLVGIMPEHFTDPELVARILARPPGELGSETLEVVPFAYGDGASFIFDADKNRLQVQCRILDSAASSQLD
jgi:hypothetical protein